MLTGRPQKSFIFRLDWSPSGFCLNLATCSYHNGKSCLVSAI